VTPDTRHRLPAVERRRLIEEAATRLFARQGFAATTVEQIVGAAGVTKPMLYRHFDSKQELCSTLLVRYRDELIEAAVAHFNPEADEPRAQRVAMIEGWLEYVERHPDAVRLVFIPIRGDDELERVQRELHRRQRDAQIALLREFVGEIDGAEAEPLGEMLRAGFAAVALWRIDHPRASREVAVRVLQRLREGVMATFGDEEHG
jgi:AcrR family transcriptional regulator